MKAKSAEARAARERAKLELVLGALSAPAPAHRAADGKDSGCPSAQDLEGMAQCSARAAELEPEAEDMVKRALHPDGPHCRPNS